MIHMTIVVVGKIVDLYLNNLSILAWYVRNLLTERLDYTKSPTIIGLGLQMLS